MPFFWIVFIHYNTKFALWKDKKLPVVNYFQPGILIAEGGITMKTTLWAVTAGLGAAAGAVAIMMMPKQNPTRKLAAKAANKAEDLAWKMEDKMMDMDF